MYLDHVYVYLYVIKIHLDHVLQRGASLIKLSLTRWAAVVMH